MIIENGNGRCFGVLYGERYGEIPRLKLKRTKSFFFLPIFFILEGRSVYFYLSKLFWKRKSDVNCNKKVKVRIRILKISRYLFNQRSGNWKEEKEGKINKWINYSKIEKYVKEKGIKKKFLSKCKNSGIIIKMVFANRGMPFRIVIRNNIGPFEIRSSIKSQNYFTATRKRFPFRRENFVCKRSLHADLHNWFKKRNEGGRRKKRGEEGRGEQKKIVFGRGYAKPDLPFKFDSKPFRKFRLITTMRNILKYFFLPRAAVDFFVDD